MRQPKYRGFCKETNQWHYGHGWFKSDYTEEYKLKKGIEDTAILYTDGYPVECVLRSMGQCTGIKDKNDKEIYEGDILEITCNFDLRKGIEVDKVYWWEDGAWSCNDWCLFELVSNAANGEQEFEIIGNKFENPKLLTP